MLNNSGLINGNSCGGAGKSVFTPCQIKLLTLNGGRFLRSLSNASILRESGPKSNNFEGKEPSWDDVAAVDWEVVSDPKFSDFINKY